MGLKLDNHGALSVKNQWVPGAGTYEPKYKNGDKTLPSYSMKGRHTFTSKMQNPGPGTYLSSQNDMKSAPKYGFGTSAQRDPTKNTISPGPGGYHIPCTIAELPAYAMPGQSATTDKFKYI